MKKSIISFLLFIVMQLVGTGLAILFVVMPKLSQLESLSVENIQALYIDEMTNIVIWGLILSDVMTFLILWALKYVKPAELVKKVPGKILLISIPMVYCVMMVLNILNATMQLPDIMAEQFKSMTDSIWGFLAIAILGPVLEEVIFRRVMIDEFTKSTKRTWLAILISALLFGLVHMNPAQIPFAFAGGIFFGWMYVQTGSMLPSIVGHIVNNSFAFLDMKYEWTGSGSEELSMSDPKMIATAIAFTIASAALIYYTVKFYSNKKALDEQL